MDEPHLPLEESPATAERETSPSADNPLEEADIADHGFGFRRAAAKVREFPQKPGVYLMKDAAGVVIYIGKAKNLRSRAGSYFLKAAAEEMRTAIWIHEICDIDFLECESEVDALLAESRLIKDIQPKYNKELKDDKTFP
ncbi:MAG: nucleotide excision repair endonuclease, partial [Planctomycetales bacterium]|nr:nucleotide excision repair endonuclease [Planctomycetales bacterium]